MVGSMKAWSHDIERDSKAYQDRHYRAHWQPLWAIIGLVLCTLLVIFGGWNAVFELCAGSLRVPTSESVVDVILIYTGMSCRFPPREYGSHLTIFSLVFSCLFTLLTNSRTAQN